MVIAGLNFDDISCEKCPERSGAFYQGNLCSRCPIFNCKKDEDAFCLIEPEDYREDWAQEFYAWIASGFVPEFYPQLRLKYEQKEEK
jgi:hypothetical protein